MQILVTGATGFVGSHLCKRLLEEGYEVYGTTKSGDTKQIKNIVEDENFSLIKLDLTKKNELPKLPKNIKAIYHNASQQPSDSSLNFEDYLDGNVLITNNLLDFYMDSKLKLFVFSSTLTVLKEHEEIINEESEVILPISDYALSKFFSEKLIKNKANNFDFKSVILRYPSIYGKGHYGGLVYYYYKKASKNQEVEVYSNGEAKRNILHVSDVVKANISTLKAYKNLDSYDLFVIGSRKSMKMVKIAKYVKNKLDSKSNIKLSEKEARGNVEVDISKAQRVLDYHPKQIEEGLDIFIEEM